MNKGIAMLIDETKRGLVELVNNKIQEGLPISVMDLILELVMRRYFGLAPIWVLFFYWRNYIYVENNIGGVAYGAFYMDC